MNFTINNTSIYLPKKIVEAPAKGPLDFLNILKRYGAIQKRHWAVDESCSFMGAEALTMATEVAGIQYSDIDMLLNGSATFDYPIPHKSCMTQELMDKHALIPSMDVGATCLGFIASCIVANGLLSQGYKRIAIINSEKCSQSLNPKHFESFYLFGDGAAATIIESEGKGKLIASHLINYPLGARYTMVQAGGNEHLGYKCDDQDMFYFQMSGLPLMKEAKRLLPKFVEELFSKAKMHWNDIDLVIPHQASKTALVLFRDMFDIPKNKMVINIDEVGNTLSASIPIALHYAEKTGQLKRGMKVLVIGTGAGFSIGALILEY